MDIFYSSMSVEKHEKSQISLEASLPVLLLSQGHVYNSWVFTCLVD